MNRLTLYEVLRIVEMMSITGNTKVDVYMVGYKSKLLFTFYTSDNFYNVDNIETHFLREVSAINASVSDSDGSITLNIWVY